MGTNNPVDLALRIVAALPPGAEAPEPLRHLMRLHSSYAYARREGDQAWTRAVSTLTAHGEITADVLHELVMVRQCRDPMLAEAVRHATSVLVRQIDDVPTEQREALLALVLHDVGAVDAMIGLGWARNVAIQIQSEETSNAHD